jgi:C4-dicarboxylate-specific signal transduction histidine kinase
VTKPFNVQELLSRVSTHLELKHSRDMIQTQNRQLVEQNAELQRLSALQETANRQLEQRVQQEVEKLQHHQQILIQRSKLESLGKLAAGIAHEINQPLAGIAMGLDNMALKISSGKASHKYLSQKIHTLQGHIDRIKRIIDHVRTFSRDQESAVIEQVDVNAVCRNALSMLHAQYTHHDIHVQLELDDAIGPALGNPYKLEQVLVNLLENARHAVEMQFRKNSGQQPYRKQIALRTRHTDGSVCLEVEDNGTGIPEREQPNIFDPFFTTRDPEHGTGLGLSISYGIVQEMQGHIGVESRVDEYTIMRISLPEISVSREERRRKAEGVEMVKI